MKSLSEGVKYETYQSFLLRLYSPCTLYWTLYRSTLIHVVKHVLHSQHSNPPPPSFPCALNLAAERAYWATDPRNRPLTFRVNHPARWRRPSTQLYCTKYPHQTLGTWWESLKTDFQFFLLNFLFYYFLFPTFLFFLRAGRPRGRNSSPGKVKNSYCSQPKLPSNGRSRGQDVKLTVHL
jgi:hypothetical protein